MSDLNYSTASFRMLQLFVAVYDMGSVTKASEFLDINQSSASHGLDRLRRVFGDPLFVKSGRGIVPTDRAKDLAPRIRSVLAEMTDLFEEETYDTATDTRPIVIATNAYARLCIVKQLFVKRDWKAAPIELRFINVGNSSTSESILMQNKADIAVAYTIGAYGQEICSQTLFEDTVHCYYDPRVRSAPVNLKSYKSAPHAVVDFGGNHDSLVDIALQHHRVERSIMLRVSSVEALPRLVKGTKLIATMPARLSRSLFADLAHCPPPVTIPPHSVDLLWHMRSNNSARNRWIREMVMEAVNMKV